MNEEDITKELNEWKNDCIGKINNFYNDKTIIENIKKSIENNYYRINLKILLKYREQNQKSKKSIEESNRQYAIFVELKEKIRKSVANKINSLSKEKLQLLAKKINKKNYEYQSNNLISERKKENIGNQLSALWQIIVERIYQIDNSINPDELGAQ